MRLILHVLAVLAVVQVRAIFSTAFHHAIATNRPPQRPLLTAFKYASPEKCQEQPHQQQRPTRSISARGMTSSSSHFDPPIPPPMYGSVLRLDEMTGLWVVFATGRSRRPADFSYSSNPQLRLTEGPDYVCNCPFCGGNEHMTTAPLLQIGNARVVPNKYPAIDPMLPHTMPRKSVYRPSRVASVHHETPAVGFHEVVIESPIHNAHIATSSNSAQARDLLLCFRNRGQVHHKQAGRGIEHTVYFKNHGATAGASLTHPHAQVVSTPVVPIEAQRLQSLALEYFKKNRVCLYERVIEEELRLHREEPHKSRVVDVSKNFVAVVPYASPGPYVVNIIPRFGADLLAQGIDCSQFTTTSDELLEECATILQSVLRRHYVALNEPCFNLVVQSSPVADRGIQAVYKTSAFYRWHIRITPRLGAGAMAGFELGSGFFSNSHIPEDDAAELRAVEPFLIEVPPTPWNTTTTDLPVS